MRLLVRFQLQLVLFDAFLQLLEVMVHRLGNVLFQFDLAPGEIVFLGRLRRIAPTR